MMDTALQKLQKLVKVINSPWIVLGNFAEKDKKILKELKGKANIKLAWVNKF